MKVTLACWSAPCSVGTLYGTAVGTPMDVLDRMKADDPLWKKMGVKFEGSWQYDASRSRLKPKTRRIYWKVKR